MAVVDTITEYDGQTYFPGDTLPDLGSLRCVSVEGGKRSYEGLLSDQAKLPTYVDNGSSALLYDGAGTTKVLHFLNGQWYEL
jgi:hypothetical protein